MRISTNRRCGISVESGAVGEAGKRDAGGGAVARRDDVSGVSRGVSEQPASSDDFNVHDAGWEVGAVSGCTVQLAAGGGRTVGEGTSQAENSVQQEGGSDEGGKNSATAVTMSNQVKRYRL